MSGVATLLLPGFDIIPGPLYSVMLGSHTFALQYQLQISNEENNTIIYSGSKPIRGEKGDKEKNIF